MNIVIHTGAFTHDGYSRLCGFGATAGLLVHVLYFIRGYHDMSALPILIVHAAVYLGLVITLVASSGFGGLVLASAVFGSYLAALFASIVVYRVFFHKLGRFPGPLAAKITKFYGPYMQRNGQMHIEQNKLFDKYGDIVRIAPNELLILSTDAIHKIHASKSGCRKRNAGVYNVLHYKGEYNLDSILDREEHRWRRQVWDRAMTTKSLAGYEPYTRQVCNTWLKKIASFDGQPIDTSLFSLLITFDHMGKVGFSYEFKTVEAGKESHMLHLLETMFGQVAALGELAWPLAIAKDLEVGGEAAEFDKLTVAMADEREKTGSPDKYDIFGFILEDYRLPKPKAIFNRNILYAEAGIILVGATDTIAAALSYAFFYLAKHQDAQRKLKDALAGLFGKTVPNEFADEDLAKVEYLNAVINETLRLENPVCNNAARLTPPEGIEVDGIWIPGGTSVRVPGYAMQRSWKAFVQPNDFIPERWTTRKDLIMDPAGFFPFLIGPNNCVGKRMAMMVIRLVLSYTVFKYRFEFAPGEDGTAIHKQARNNLILKAGPLKLAFTDRVTENDCVST